MSVKRVFLIILDSLGAGEAPDADKFGDVGANTLRSLSRSDKLKIENCDLHVWLTLYFH